MGSQTQSMGRIIANVGNSMAGQNRITPIQPTNTFTGVNPDQVAFQQPQFTGGKGSSTFSPANVNTQNQYATQDMPQGKGASGQAFTYSPTSGQPQMGRPNQYTNTVGGWDNASIQPSVQRSGKGKGG